MSQITTHILDTSKGRPATGVTVILFQESDSSWTEIGRDITNSDGRATSLIQYNHPLPEGIYKLQFLTREYFTQRDLTSFYPYVEIVFQIRNAEHYHVPLLLTPYGYTTYRGS